MGRPANAVASGIAALSLAAFLFTACGTVPEAEEDEDASSSLRQHEAQFRPSDYDEAPADFLPRKQPAATHGTDSSTAPLSTQPAELAQGYRVQVLSTTSIDEAKGLRAALEAQFPDEWFYIVYDAPTYKLRAGNFLQRWEADQLTRLLAEKGYRDSWVVPERVFKNPPPRSSQSDGQRK